jgi:predicted enzyme related to lactoylglutathione lyase
MAQNPVRWWEIASHDAEKTKEFLERLFDWKSEYDERIGTWDFPAEPSDNGFAGGGVFTLKKAKLPFLTLYVQVDDVDERASRIEELGGHVVEAPFDVVEGVRICLFNEPSGVTLAMVQKRKE